MTRARFDLHTHSTASDGVLPPREVVALAAERGLAGVALTDHDTTDGLAEAIGMAQLLSIRCIAGVELSCSSLHANDIHILGYLIDPNDAKLTELLKGMRDERMRRAQLIVDKVRSIAGDALTMDDVLAQSGGAPPGRPHIARAMAKRGLVTEFDDAFSDQWIGSGGRAYVARKTVPLEHAIGIIHQAGGVAVYAHPGARIDGSIDELAIRQAAQFGLDGIEVDHPLHDGAVVERCAALATELALIQTAGSDDHGQGPEGSRLGCRTVAGRIVSALDARAAHRRS